VSFERVETRGHAEAPCITVISDGNTAYINQPGCEQFFEDVDHVELYADHERGRIGIARNGETGRSTRLRSREGAGLSLSITPLLRSFGIEAADLDSGVRLPLEHDHEEGLLIADAEPLIKEADG
jgi:hypothetical protein